MNVADIITIETRLNVALPEPYRSMLLEGITLVGTPLDPYIDLDPKRLLLTNVELRMTAHPNAFSGESWPKEYIYVGEDGCGNFYYVVDGDAQCAVGFFDHETDTFEVQFKDWWAFLATIGYLVNLLKQSAAPRSEPLDPETSTTEESDSRGAVMARTEDAMESVLNPISLAEWTRFVDSDDELKMRGYEIRIDPFTQDELPLDCPGLVILSDGDIVNEFRWGFGRISISNPSPKALAKLRQAAAALEAKVTS